MATDSIQIARFDRGGKMECLRSILNDSSIKGATNAQVGLSGPPCIESPTHYVYIIIIIIIIEVYLKVTITPREPRSHARCLLIKHQTKLLAGWNLTRWAYRVILSHLSCIFFESSTALSRYGV